MLFAALLFAYPAIYYIAYTHPRYRHPIEPEMLLLGVYLICEAGRRAASDAATRSEAEQHQE
jgi:hypothetical protein